MLKSDFTRAAVPASPECFRSLIRSLKGGRPEKIHFTRRLRDSPFWLERNCESVDLFLVRLDELIDLEHIFRGRIIYREDPGAHGLLVLDDPQLIILIARDRRQV